MIKKSVIAVIIFVMVLVTGLVACGGTPSSKSSDNSYPPEFIEVEDTSDIGYPDITVYGAPDKWDVEDAYYYVVDNQEGTVYLQHFSAIGNASTESMSVMLKRNGEPLTIDDLRRD